MEDAQIVDLYWQRSDEAITQTQKKYGRYCYTVANNVLGDALDAEECVNDTYLAAWNSMPDNRPASLPPYLGKITRNFALTRLTERRALKRGRGQTEAALDELGEILPDGETPEQTTERKALSERVNAFLGTLPETERVVFVGRYWYAMPVDAIASRMGFTRSKTAAMLHRIREKLRAQLTKEEWL